MPAAKKPELVVQVAVPPLIGCVPQPVIVVPPEVKLTFPASVPKVDVTVAVKVTEDPFVEGLLDDATDVELAALPTV